MTPLVFEVGPQTCGLSGWWVEHKSGVRNDTGDGCFCVGCEVTPCAKVSCFRGERFGKKSVDSRMYDDVNFAFVLESFTCGHVERLILVEVSCDGNNHYPVVLEEVDSHLSDSTYAICR